MTPALSRKSALFLFLGVFALLFGFASDTFAVLSCTNEAATWKNANFDCTILYEDPGGANLGLATCKYKLINTVSGHDTGWIEASGTCSGSSATLQAAITVGVGQNCRDNGADTCEAHVQATDNAGNAFEGPLKTSPPPGQPVTYDIDYSAPTLAQVIAVLSPTNDTTPDYTFSSTESGTITYGGDCSSATGTATAGNNTITFNALAQGTHSNCTIKVTDAAGNPSNVLSVNPFTVDTTAPTVTSFSINGTSCSGTPCTATITTNTAITLAWSSTDTGGSGVQKHEVWRAPDSGGNPGTWTCIIGVGCTVNRDANPVGESDNPADGTYWYGVHTLDNAGNCITEDTSGADQGHSCGGVIFDGLDNPPNPDGRLDKGPIKVIMQHNQSPAAPSSLSQFKNDGTTAIVNQGLTNESNVKLRASATDPDTTEILKLFFEVRSNADVFVDTLPGTLCTTETWTSCINKVWFVASLSGNFSVTPFTGTASIAGLSTGTGYKWRVKACDDDNACSSWRAFNITTPNFIVNAPPIANAQAVPATEDIPRAITLTGSDIETCELTFTVGNPSSGTLGSIVNVACVSGTPQTDRASIIYTPTHNFSGSDAFLFQVNDGTAGSNVATVTITVTPVNDAPVFGAIANQTVNEDAGVQNVAITGVGPGGGADEAGQTVTLTAVSSNTAIVPNPSIAGSGATRTLTYQPVANANGTVTITVTANDGQATNNIFSRTFTITVTDGTAPTIGAFSINGTSCSGTPCTATITTNTAITLAWSSTDTGGSGVQKHEVWRAADSGGSPGTWTCIIGIGCTVNRDANPVGESDNPADGTYWYGVHTLDNAGNCITEDTSGADKGHSCGGVTSDGLDTRADRGPIKVVMLHNQPPAISSVSDSPDPIKASALITFTVNWSDLDAGDLTKIHICKTDAISGQTCSGGSWCDSALFSSSSPTSCNYTTAAADAGTKSYFAFVCDDENACSSSKSGTFLVDATVPTISSFTRTPVPPAWVSNGSPNATVTWSVADSGGANLKQIEVWRAWDANGNGVLDTTPTSEWSNPGNGQSNPLCTKTGGPPKCTSDQNFDTASTDSDFYIDSNLAASGKYWYGLHVVDKADNLTTEANPLLVQVDKENPIAAISDPPDSTWWKDNLVATFEDVDPAGGSGLSSLCEYEYYDLTSGTSSGVQSRSCGFGTKTITVGPSPDICRTQGFNLCEVRSKATDQAGNFGEIFVNFGVDFTNPFVGIPFPNTAQAGVSQTFTSSLRDGVGMIAGCSFFWKTLGSNWSNPIATTIIPNVCGNGENCTVSANHMFLSQGQYDIMFGCEDLAQPDPGNRGWGVGSVQVESLSVDLSAVPSSGSVNTLFDLVATVSGTMAGNINYKFDCTNNGTWELEVNNSSINPYTAVDLCQYSSPATYTAKVFVQRGVGTAQDTMNIPVSADSIPSTTNPSVDPANPTDYFGAIGFPPVRVRWVFSDADPGDTQSAYELEVFQGGTKVVDTGKRLGSTQSYVFQSAGEQLLWDTTYTWQVRVWDSQDDPSAFTLGPQFTTPKHHYPVPNFAWTPALPGVQESVQFTDQTNFAAGATGKTWSWSFGDGGSSTSPNPSHTYTQTGAFGVTLQSTDDVGSVSLQKTVNISIPFPEWQEVSPF